MRHFFKPVMADIKQIVEETPDTKSFFFDRNVFGEFSPGQFAELWVPGVGEIPISIASSPEENELKFTVKKVGTVTAALFGKKVGDSIGIRGPFGHGFPIDGLDGKRLVFIGGGIGLPPLMSALVYASQKGFENITLLYGARTPADIVYKDLLSRLKGSVRVFLTVDRGDSSWTGEVGVVTNLIREETVRPENSVAFVCGPGIMMFYTVRKLLEVGFDPGDIYLSLEQHMKCAIGKCGHCRIGPYFVCVDGPVFSYTTLKEVEEKFAGDIWG